MLSKVIEIFRNLEGHWKFKRQISEEGSSHGEAHFQNTAWPLTFHYREDSIFTTTQGADFKTFREYIYRYENGTISVFFIDPPDSLFHTLTFDTDNQYPILAHAKHLCDCDTYDATYNFLSPIAFTLTYRVKGPKKDYRIETSFEKIPR